MARVWITKHALTDGIIACDVEDGHGPYIWFQRPNSRHQQVATPSQWFANEHSAILDAESKRQSRIRSLDKQRDKIANMAINILDMT